MKNKQPENTISVSEAVNLIQATERTIRNWIHNKSLETIKIGNRVWIKLESFERYVNERGIETLNKVNR